MYKVFYSNSKLTSPCDFGECATIEEAVMLAMAVHRSSNVPHHIEVTNPDRSHLISFDLIDRGESVRESK